MADKSILKKIQKLLALANSDNEHEAALASAQAHRLMLQYNVEAQDTEQLEYENSVLDQYKRAPVEQKWITNLLHKHFSVRFVTSRKKEGTSLKILGTCENVEIARYVYAFLMRSYKDLWKVYKSQTGATVNSKQAFYSGVFKGLDDKLTASKAQFTEETGLIPVDQSAALQRFMNSQFSNLRSGSRVSRYRGDNSAKDAGYSAGKNLNIRSGLNNGKSNFGGYLS